MARISHTLPARFRRARQRGMTLVEVLVALVIFALGMLGAGGLIMASLRSGQHTAQASVAIGLARDYGELMQLIPASVQSSAASSGNPFLFDTNTTMTAPTSCQGASAACTPTEMINFGKYDWAQRVKSALPGGRAVVCQDTAPKNADGLYEWTCDNTGTLVVVKFDWVTKVGPAGTGDDNLDDARPKMVVTLFGNQTDFVTP